MSLLPGGVWLLARASSQEPIVTFPELGELEVLQTHH